MWSPRRPVFQSGHLGERQDITDVTVRPGYSLTYRKERDRPSVNKGILVKLQVSMLMYPEMNLGMII